MFRLLTLLSLAFVALADQDVVSVPAYLMNYILECKQQVPGGYGVPVYQTHIEGTQTSQHVSLLDLDELGESLKKSVNNHAVVEQIMRQVNSAVADKSRGRSDCTVENHIEIEVPPQEIDEFNDRVQMLIRQNSFLLLEQINTLFAFKLRSLKSDVDKAIRRRTKDIESKLDLIMAHLGIEVPEEDNDSDNGDDYDEASEVPEVTDSVFPSVVGIEATSEPEPEASPATTVEPSSEPEPVAEPEPIAEPAPLPEPTQGPFSSKEDDDDDANISASDAPVNSFEDTTDASATHEDTSDERLDVTSSSGFIRTPQQPASGPIITPSGIGLMPFFRRRYREPTYNTQVRSRINKR